MEIYRKNAELLVQAVEANAAIFPIERQRREDGRICILEGHRRREIQ